MIVGIETAIPRIRGASGRGLRAWGALAVVLGVGLGWVPLFGVLGFELATAVALFAAVMGLDLGSALAREGRGPGGGGGGGARPGRRAGPRAAGAGGRRRARRRSDGPVDGGGGGAGDGGGGGAGAD